MALGSITRVAHLYIIDKFRLGYDEKIRVIIFFIFVYRDVLSSFVPRTFNVDLVVMGGEWYYYFDVFLVIVVSFFEKYI